MKNINLLFKFWTKTLQIAIFITVNILFTLKYFDRFGINPYISAVFYIIFIVSFIILYQNFIYKIPERYIKFCYLLLIVFMIGVIINFFININPYSIRVDRWSALYFFWESIFQGNYPYTTHTHVSDTNFASPFPFWHLLHLPFYLLGEVGIGIIFFLLMFSFVLQWYFGSYYKSFFFLLLLGLSPGYWWEVSARSDSLSNALLVIMIIFWLIKTHKTLSNNFWLIAFVCGCVAATRMSALIPLALFFFQPYLKLKIKQKIFFPLAVLLIALIYFLPFILWDTDTWIFFKRNPFMSQTENGYLSAFLLMLIVGVFFSLKWKNYQQYFAYTAVFIFIFILANQIVRIIRAGEGNLFSDAIADISYFNLLLPYCIAFITVNLDNSKRIITETK